MAKAAISITNTGSIVDEIMRRQEMVARRAFDLFQSHADQFRDELDDWFRAEEELFPQPSLRFRQADGRFEIDAALPGADPGKVDVRVTSEDLLITAERAEPKPDPSAAKAGAAPGGMVQYFRTIHLPEPIDPDKVKADYKEGTLHLTIPLLKPQMKSVEMRA